jgi:hypothetical protein
MKEGISMVAYSRLRKIRQEQRLNVPELYRTLGNRWRDWTFAWLERFAGSAM